MFVPSLYQFYMFLLSKSINFFKKINEINLTDAKRLNSSLFAKTLSISLKILIKLITHANTYCISTFAEKSPKIKNLSFKF